MDKKIMEDSSEELGEKKEKIGFEVHKRVVASKANHAKNYSLVLWLLAQILHPSQHALVVFDFILWVYLNK